MIVELSILAVVAGFPQEYRGRWGEDIGGCSPGAIHGGLTIERRTVRDGEFIGRVRSVRHKPDGSINATERWDVPEEGLKDFVNNYRLSKNRTSLTVRDTAGEADTQRLIRCKRQR